MVRRLRGRIGVVYDLAGTEATGEGRRKEYEIEAHVGVPGGESEALVVWVEQAVAIHIAPVEHDPDRVPVDVATAQPDERPEPRRHAPGVEQLTGGQGVEVTYEHMKASLVFLDGFD